MEKSKRKNGKQPRQINYIKIVIVFIVILGMSLLIGPVIPNIGTGLAMIVLGFFTVFGSIRMSRSLPSGMGYSSSLPYHDLKQHNLVTYEMKETQREKRFGDSGFAGIAAVIIGLIAFFVM